MKSWLPSGVSLNRQKTPGSASGLVTDGASPWPSLQLAGTGPPAGTITLSSGASSSGIVKEGVVNPSLSTGPAQAPVSVAPGGNVSGKPPPPSPPAPLQTY